MHLLLVEDNLADIFIVEEALEELDIKVDLATATDGQAAMKYLEDAIEGDTCRVDLVLLDINIPKLNGREVLKRIKEDPRYARVMTFMVTTSGYVEDVRISYAHGANAYIVKSMDIDEFTSNICQSIHFAQRVLGGYKEPGVFFGREGDWSVVGQP